MSPWDERPDRSDPFEPDSSLDTTASQPLSHWHSLSQTGPLLAPDRPLEADDRD